MYHTGNPLQLGGFPSPQQLVSVPIASSVSTSVTWTNPPVSSLLPLSQSTIPSLIRPADNTPLFVPTTTVSGSLSLSLSSDPIPAKVVHSIRSGQYVEMRDLLGDNMALTQHLESIHGYFPLHILPGASRPRLREVTTLPQWIYCFLAYLAVKTTDPLTRDQLAYARLIVSQAQRHGGQGWLEYDRLFRRQSALDPSLPWNMIQPGLQATTILGQHPGMGHFCTLCRGFDHQASQCAMSFTQPQNRTDRTVESRPQRRPDRSQNVCKSWNEGGCIFPGSCTYRHVCATCHQTHRARDCKDTPATSRLKRRPHIPTTTSS